MRAQALLLALALAVAGEGARAEALTLEQALAAVDEPHPDLRIAAANESLALAERGQADARMDWNVNFEAGLRRARPISGADPVSDNTLILDVRKPLYDFGRSAAAVRAADSLVGARRALLLDARTARRLDIMESFFDVLTADLQYDTNNEYMAVAYVDFDNARDRQQVGKLSAVDLAELESRYQEQLVKRNASQTRQRLTRNRLANVLNRPGQAVAELVDPELPTNERALPEYEQLLPILREHNPKLVAYKAQLAAATDRIEGVRAEKAPLLEMRLQASDYNREAATRDRANAGVVLSWPLYTGNRVDARMAQEQAQFQRLQAETDKLTMDLEQSLLETWLEIGDLKRSQRGAAKKNADFRDLALERARGQYEVELKTNLGTSMAATMEAKWRQRTVEYRLALAYTRLEGLLGQPLASLPDTTKGTGQ